MEIVQIDDDIRMYAPVNQLPPQHNFNYPDWYDDGDDGDDTSNNGNDDPDYYPSDGEEVLD